MMGDLLRYVEPLRAVFVVISTSKEFAQYGVIPVCHELVIVPVESPQVTALTAQTDIVRRADSRFLHALGLDVPASEVVLQHTDEAFLRVVAVFRSTNPEMVRKHSRQTAPMRA